MTFINKQSIPTLDGLKKSSNYDYDSVNRNITINDNDFSSVVSVYNETINKVLYVLGDEAKNGNINKRNLVYTSIIEGVSNSDVLVILYKPLTLNFTEERLVEILEELRINNKILKKIYKQD